MAILAFDTFQRANENPLNPSFWSIYTGADAMQIQSDFCIPTVNFDVDSELCTAISWPNNQWTQATIGANVPSDGTRALLRVRGSASVGAGYSVFISGTSWDLATYDSSGNLASVFASGTTTTLKAGDVLYLSVVGTTVTAKRNGTTLGSGTASTTASGSPGLGGLSATGVNEIKWTNWLGGDFSAPAPSSISPTSGAQGATIANFTVNGTDFDANGGATISFSGTGITVNSYSVRSSTQIVASITIASNAALTARDVVVTNASDGQQGTLSAAFTVTAAAPTVYSVPDCRDYGNFPNLPVNVQGTQTYTVPSVDSRAAGAPVDSRAAGAPKDCRKAPNIPENSRNKP